MLRILGKNSCKGSESYTNSFRIHNTANCSYDVFSLTKTFVFFVEEVWDRYGGGDAGVPVRREVLACQAEAGSGLDKIYQDIPTQVIRKHRKISPMNLTGFPHYIIKSNVDLFSRRPWAVFQIC
jgi:hypothetical protein